MSELLWTCESGSVFCSEIDGIRLTVVRAPSGHGFRYQLFREQGSVASGHRRELREALAAAERTAKAFSSTRSAVAA